MLSVLMTLMISIPFDTLSREEQQLITESAQRSLAESVPTESFEKADKAGVHPALDLKNCGGLNEFSIKKSIGKYGALEYCVTPESFDSSVDKLIEWSKIFEEK